jgi:tripartite ATP-independent transporter DctP family solute receptor
MKMKKKLISIVLIACLLFINVGCGSSGNRSDASGSTSTTPDSSAGDDDFKARTLKLGSGAVKIHTMNVAGDDFARLMSEKTGGKFIIDSYADAQLGNDREVFEQTSNGMLDLSIGALANAVAFLPDLGVFDLPFLFEDYEHVQRVLDSDIMSEYEELLLEKANIKVLVWSISGFRQVYSTRGPIKEPVDLRGVKIRVLENPVYIDFYNEVSAVPTPMANSEIYTALQQHTIDAVDNGAFPISFGKYSDFGGALSLTNHTFGFAVLFMSKKTWDSLTPEEQALAEEAAEEVQGTVVDNYIKGEAVIIDEMAAGGMEVVQPEDINREAIAVDMVKIYPKYEEEFGDLGKRTIEAIQALK